MHRSDNNEMEGEKGNDKEDFTDPVDLILHNVLKLQTNFNAEISGLKATIYRQSATIHRLNVTVKTLVHRQANLPSLLKEILENSFSAHATNSLMHPTPTHTPTTTTTLSLPQVPIPQCVPAALKAKGTYANITKVFQT